MPECSYCDAEFADEAAYREHLRDAHADDLDRIDRKRAGLDGSDEDGPPLALYAVLVGGVLLALVGVYLVAGGSSPGSNGSAAAAPHDLGSVHYHGTIQVTIDGQSLDFSRDRYQKLDRHFHFESNEGERWHVHGQGVTLEYAMGTLGIDVREGGDVVAFDGTTYRDGDAGTSVSVTVNGEPVTPSEYVLQKGDRVRIVVETE
jgi:sulfur carrier protein ThiS